MFSESAIYGSKLRGTELKRYWKKLTLAIGCLLFVVFAIAYAALILSYASMHDVFLNYRYALMCGLIMLAALIVLWVCACIFLKKIDSIFTERNARMKRIIDTTNHELKTPLTLSMANLDLLEMENGPDELIDDMREEMQHMTHLVHKMVGLSEVKEGEWELTLVSTNASKLVGWCVEAFQSRAASEGLRLLSDVGDAIYCEIDETEIKQIMFVLLDNAIKYCDEGGVVTVQLSAEGPLQIEIRVENTFAAVDPEEFPRFFDRFYRGERAIEKTSGDGLGLPIALLAIKKLGGTVEVYERAEINAIGFKVNV